MTRCTALPGTRDLIRITQSLLGHPKIKYVMVKTKFYFWFFRTSWNTIVLLLQSLIICPPSYVLHYMFQISHLVWREEKFNKSKHCFTFYNFFYAEIKHQRINMWSYIFTTQYLRDFVKPYPCPSESDPFFAQFKLDS